MDKKRFIKINNQYHLIEHLTFGVNLQDQTVHIDLAGGQADIILDGQQAWDLIKILDEMSIAWITGEING